MAADERCGMQSDFRAACRAESAKTVAAQSGLYCPPAQEKITFGSGVCALAAMLKQTVKSNDRKGLTWKNGSGATTDC